MKAEEILERLKEKITVHSDQDITLFREPYTGGLFQALSGRLPKPLF